MSGVGSGFSGCGSLRAAPRAERRAHGRQRGIGHRRVAFGAGMERAAIDRGHRAPGRVVDVARLQHVGQPARNVMAVK